MCYNNTIRPQLDGWGRNFTHRRFFACVLERFQKAAPIGAFFCTHTKKIFLGILEEKAPTWRLGVEFHAPVRFRLHSRAVPKSSPTGAFFRTHTNKYFLAFWWRRPQLDGWGLNFAHRCVFASVQGRFRKSAPWVQFFRAHAKEYFSAFWWGRPHLNAKK